MKSGIVSGLGQILNVLEIGGKKYITTVTKKKSNQEALKIKDRPPVIPISQALMV